MFKHLAIEYSDPNNLSDTVVIKYKLRSDKVVGKWISKVLEAKASYPIDDPGRFYCFNDYNTEEKIVLDKIIQCIDVINSHGNIVERKPTSITDYDTLNYLHHIFEVYHGLLDSQTHEFYVSAPVNVRQALAELNILVHRCESLAYSSTPRHVVTYYGLPKTDMLELSDYDTMTDEFKFGEVYLNYAEIGKTLEDLALDNDVYIADEAFKPLRYYTADFSVRFADSRPEQVEERRGLTKRYYAEHENFFKECGLPYEHPFLKMGKIPLANIAIDMDRASVLELIKTRQYVKSVNFI
jgi:hypothetical protein